MGQKVHPKGFRLGVYRDWDSRWFARGSYADQLMEDIAIRRFLAKELKNAEVSRIELEKAGENIRIIIHSARPGIVIGKKGQEIENLRTKISSKFPGRAVEVSVQEVENPDADAMTVARSIAEQLERRVSFKRAMKRAAAGALRAGAKGIKIRCAGRLGGAEIARAEWLRIGSIPLHTLRANVDYGQVTAHTTYGVIGVTVWIYKGDFQLSK
ncbi:30S ribosomal protein S3 [Candidatus Babeliales bacterium]|nr:30S ribosomal protein S3 [Candidatus Babeliales bacterium]